MKTLVIQLARFGDILQTWPVLTGLCRGAGDGQIHLLVRERFRAAADLHPLVHGVKSLDTKRVLGPLLAAQTNDIDSALGELESFIGGLQEEQYDRIINLSFSPFSSYLTNILGESGAEIYGYTRSPDGHLAIPDDSSAYFYAQVGIGRWNRAHLTEVMAAVSGIDLQESDWRDPRERASETAAIEITERWNLAPQRYIVVQVGASRSNKTLSPFQWTRALNRWLRGTELNVVLVGASDEKQVCENIRLGLGVDRVVNLAGRTQISDIFSIVQGAQLVVGGDSLLMQVASLVGKRCLNLSFSSVNFWETAPRVQGSRIIWAAQPEDLASDRIALEIESLFRGESSGFPVIQVLGRRIEDLNFVGYEPNDFPWRMIQAIYMDGEFPAVREPVVVKALTRLSEVCDLAQDYLPRLLDSAQRGVSLQVLEQVDVMLIEIQRMVPAVGPLIEWFNTERLRIGPMSVEALIEHQFHLFEKLRCVAQAMPNESKETPKEEEAPNGR